jgi:hypothetical protein
MHNRLVTLGIDHTWDDYGPGTHNFAYWNRSLQRTLPTFMNVFAENRQDPRRFSYRSIESTYDIYGWTVTMDRPVVEFSALEGVSREGFTLSGSGDATVVSAPVYEPGATYDVTVGSTESRQQANEEGRLTIAVPLGAANPVQQYFTPTGESPATTVHETVVTIEPLPG